MKKLLIFVCLLIFVLPIGLFAQTGAAAVRDYVGVINQTYHPDIVSYLQKWKAIYTRQGHTNAARGIDLILSGAFGSGFLYSDARGNFYVITNNHVVAHAHTLSITFERADGTTRKIENLSIIATDVEADLAILALPAGERPLVNRGLALATRAVQEGEDIFSAGFPGLGATPIWQFSRGMVSNANVRFPKSLDDETMMGPYIQHTSQIDAGNSGGPLLFAQANAPSGYAVAGINTLSGINRQAANYAIPANKIQEFVNSALNPRPETFRAALDTRLEQFVGGFSQTRAAYPHIAQFLSVACVGENAEWATDELDKRANQSVKRSFLRTFTESIADAMAISVAWSIEDSIRSSSGAINIALKEVTGEGTEYTVVFTINSKDVNSVWIREYGNWRIRSFGTVATGDTSRNERRQNDRTARANMGADSEFRLEAGYAMLINKKSPEGAFHINFDFNTYGLSIFAGPDGFFNLGIYFGGHFPIPISGSFGLMPYLRGGMGFTFQKEEVDFMDDGPTPIYSQLFAVAGIKIIFPGKFFIGAGFQYNLNLDFIGGRREDPFEMAAMFTIGYSF